MMAKMFYTMDETKAALGKSEEEIKQLARDGRLREFRDGPRLMFKADAVETLKQELTGDVGVSGSGLEGIDLGPSDSGSPIGLADSKGSSGAALSLSDTDQAGSSVGVRLKDDTALAADLGLSGSVGAVPSPGRIGSGSGLSGIGSGNLGGSPALSGSGLSGGSAGGSRSGSISVFDADEVEHADPSAQTSISAASGLSDSRLNVEGVGSGSGLLDLTQESDNTSLGAVLDEIGPSGSGAAAARTTGDSVLGGSSRVGDSGVSSSPGRSVIARGMGMTQYVEAEDPWAPAFAGAALAGFIALLFATFVLTSAVMGTSPKMLADLAARGFPIIAAAGLVLAIILFIIGMVLGKASARR